jgi:hypothetical protein
MELLWNKYHLDKFIKKYLNSSNTNITIGIKSESTSSIESHEALRNIPGNRSIIIQEESPSEFSLSLAEIARRPLPILPSINELDREQLEKAFQFQPGPIPGFDPSTIGLRKEDEPTIRRKRRPK